MVRVRSDCEVEGWEKEGKEREGGTEDREKEREREREREGVRLDGGTPLKEDILILTRLIGIWRKIQRKKQSM